LNILLNRIYLLNVKNATHILVMTFNLCLCIVQ